MVKRFQASSITERFGRYIKQAGIEKSGSVYIFRHSTATAMLGHADLSTTQVYTHVAITQLKEVHDKTHPAELDESQEEDE